MVAWRNAAGTAAASNWQTGNSNQIAFSRNSAAFIALNREQSSSWTATLATGLPSGTYCNVANADDANADDTTRCSQTVVVGSSGSATVTVRALSAVAFHINAKRA